MLGLYSSIICVSHTKFPRVAWIQCACLKWRYIALTVQLFAINDIIRQDKKWWISSKFCIKKVQWETLLCKVLFYGSHNWLWCVVLLHCFGEHYFVNEKLTCALNKDLQAKITDRYNSFNKQLKLLLIMHSKKNMFVRYH